MTASQDGSEVRQMQTSTALIDIDMAELVVQSLHSVGLCLASCAREVDSGPSSERLREATAQIDDLVGHVQRSVLASRMRDTASSPQLAGDPSRAQAEDPARAGGWSEKRLAMRRASIELYVPGSQTTAPGPRPLGLTDTARGLGLSDPRRPHPD